MSNGPTFDPSIPVLTEVFRDEPAQPGSGPADLPPSSEPPANAESADSEWRMLEQRLSERIMEELRASLQPTIEKIVAEAVAQEVARLQAVKK